MGSLETTATVLGPARPDRRPDRFAVYGKVLSAVSLVSWPAFLLLPGDGAYAAIRHSFALATFVLGVVQLGRHLVARRRRPVAPVPGRRGYGAYTLGEKVGQGGMGTVFRAHHSHLTRPTAIKLLSRDLSASSLARFEREAQLTSQLTHPSSVVVHDYGRTDDGGMYYAMEYLDGIDLDKLTDADGPQPAARVIHMLRQVCGALAEAHASGLIHRDIKPANLFLCRRSHDFDLVKVLDYGLVKDLRAPRVDLSGAALMGTPLYMSPESVLTPGRIDARSDLYSLGAAAYQLLTGVPVFSGQSAPEVWGQILHVEPRPPSQRTGRPIPADLEAVVMKCLAKSPDDRYANASELADALAACADAGTWTAAAAQQWWTARAAAIAPRRAEAA